MIRLSPWGVAPGELAAPARLRGDAGLLRRVTAPTHGAWFWISRWVVGVAAGLAALLPAVTDDPSPIAGSQVVLRLAGLSFVVCGLTAWRRRPDSGVGPLMAFAGVSLFAYPIASQLGSDLLLTVATLFASVWTIAFAALILSFQSGGRLQTPVDRLLVGVAVFALFILQFTRMLFAPFPGNVLVVHGDLSAFNTIGDIQFVFTIGVSLGIVAVVAARWSRASAPGRRALLPSVAGCLCSLTFSAMLFVYLVTREIPEWLSWVTSAALLTVPAAFLAGMLRSRLARGGLAELFRELGGSRCRPASRRASATRGSCSPTARARATGTSTAGGSRSPRTATDARSPASSLGVVDARRADARAREARRLLRGQRGARQRRQVRAGHAGDRAGHVPTSRPAPACAGWRIAWPRSTARCASPALPAPGPSSRPRCPAEVSAGTYRRRAIHPITAWATNPSPKSKEG